jgi:hypothetical protein
MHCMDVLAVRQDDVTTGWELVGGVEHPPQLGLAPFREHADGVLVPELADHPVDPPLRCVCPDRDAFELVILPRTAEPEACFVAASFRR